jgi:hypothetical protein
LDGIPVYHLKLIQNKSLHNGLKKLSKNKIMDLISENPPSKDSKWLWKPAIAAGLISLSFIAREYFGHEFFPQSIFTPSHFWFYRYPF